MNFIKLALESLTAHHREQTRALVKKAEKSTIFQTVDWHESLPEPIEGNREIILAFDDEDLVGYYLSYSKKKFGIFKSYNSSGVATPYGFPVVENINSPIFDLLLENYSTQKRALSYYFTTPPLFRKELILEHQYQVSDEHPMAFLELGNDEEKLFQSFSKSRRGDIRKSQKNNVKIVKSDQSGLKNYYEMVLETSKRANFTPYSFEMFRSVYLNLKKKNMAELFFAIHDDKILSGAIILFWNKSAYYWDSASSGHKRELQSTSLLLWEAMLEALKRNISFFDLLGASIKPITKFKKGFNCKIANSYTLSRKSFFLKGITKFKN